MIHYLCCTTTTMTQNLYGRNVPHHYAMHQETNTSGNHPLITFSLINHNRTVNLNSHSYYARKPTQGRWYCHHRKKLRSLGIKWRALQSWRSSCALLIDVPRGSIPSWKSLPKLLSRKQTLWQLLDGRVPSWSYKVQRCCPWRILKYCMCS